MVNNNISNSDRLKSGICYLPLGGAFFHFTEKNKSAYLVKHIKYWTFLFIAFLLVRIVFIWLYLPIGWILLLVYLWWAIYLWLKAYHWENIDIEAIDSFYSNNFKWNKNTSNPDKNNEEVKEEQFNQDEWESVIKTNNIVVDKIANWLNKIVGDVKKDQKDEFYEWDDETTDSEIKKENKKDEDVLDF